MKKGIEEGLLTSTGVTVYAGGVYVEVAWDVFGTTSVHGRDWGGKGG